MRRVRWIGAWGAADAWAGGTGGGRRMGGRCMWHAVSSAARGDTGNKETSICETAVEQHANCFCRQPAAPLAPATQLQLTHHSAAAGRIATCPATLNLAHHEEPQRQGAERCAACRADYEVGHPTSATPDRHSACVAARAVALTPCWLLERACRPPAAAQRAGARLVRVAPAAPRAAGVRSRCTAPTLLPFPARRHALRQTLRRGGSSRRRPRRSSPGALVGAHSAHTQFMACVQATPLTHIHSATAGCMMPSTPAMQRACLAA